MTGNFLVAEDKVNQAGRPFIFYGREGFGMERFSFRVEALLVVMAIFFACNIYTLIPIFENVGYSINIPPEKVVSYLSILKSPHLLMGYGIVFLLLFTFVGYYDSLSRHSPGTSSQMLAIRSVGLAGAILSIFTGYFTKQYGGGEKIVLQPYLGEHEYPAALVSFWPLHLLLSSILFVSAISLLLPTIITFIDRLAEADRGKDLSLYSFF
jgi:predicted MFS family arabinose efflux permease